MRDDVGLGCEMVPKVPSESERRWMEVFMCWWLLVRAEQQMTHEEFMAPYKRMIARFCGESRRGRME